MNNSSVVTSELIYGSEKCPCLLFDRENLDDSYLGTFVDVNDISIANVNDYGFGCKAHDLGTSSCTPGPSDLLCEEKIPRPKSCDREWCEHEWCYVDPNNCQLLHERSIKYQKMNLYYSYATCGYMDKFVNEERINHLQEKTYQVGYLASSGGWKGAYSTAGHFARSGWSGPLVDFFETAAYTGGFNINLTQPPSHLKQLTIDHWSDSSWDACAYAAILGYLDFCVGTFTLTSERAASGTFFSISSQPLYLITVQDESVGWSSIWENAGNVFKPFTLYTWGLILFVVLPVMSLLMTLHESREKSSDEKSCQIFTPNSHLDGCDTSFESAVEQQEPRKNKVGRKIVRVSTIIWNSFFKGYNAFLTQSYEMKGSSVGGRLTVLGLGFFILAIVTSYTANLAAMLTDNIRSSTVGSIEDAIKAGYNFCGERKAVSLVINTYNIPHLIVPDPEDGEPGYNCMTCKSRQRALDFVKHGHNDRSLYCDAAIAIPEDIDDLQMKGLHCNKTIVGKPIGYIDWAVPIYDGISDEIIALLQQLKNEGVFDAKLARHTPSPQCSKKEDDEGVRLNPIQLTGVWILTFTFAMAGLVTLLIEVCVEKRQKSIEMKKFLKKVTRGSMY